MEYFAQLLKDRELIDVTFVIEGKHFEVHRLVLASKSKYFKALLYGPLRDKGDTIHYDSCNAVTFQHMIDHAYGNEKIEFGTWVEVIDFHTYLHYIDMKVDLDIIYIKEDVPNDDYIQYVQALYDHKISRKNIEHSARYITGDVDLSLLPNPLINIIVNSHWFCVYPPDVEAEVLKRVNRKRVNRRIVFITIHHLKITKKEFKAAYVVDIVTGFEEHVLFRDVNGLKEGDIIIPVITFDNYGNKVVDDYDVLK